MSVCYIPAGDHSITSDEIEEMDDLCQDGFFSAERFKISSAWASPTGTEDSEAASGRRLVLFTALAAIVFGAVHLLAWNSVFPSYAEKILWRVSSFITMFGPLATLGVVLIAVDIENWVDNVFYFIVVLLSIIFCVCCASQIIVLSSPRRVCRNLDS
jgi:hypothetical protein